MDRNVIIKDISGRTIYGLKALYNDKVYDVEYVDCYDEVKLVGLDYTISCDDIKIYLRPLSTMTADENDFINDAMSCLWKPKEDLFILTDFLDRQMFDYRSLIKGGAALPAPEGMYPTFDAHIRMHGGMEYKNDDINTEDE